VAARRSDADFISEINVTPLVDVMLVLLIVMMVTASYVVTKSLGVDLPKAAEGGQSEKSLVVTVESDGQWRLEGASINETQLRQEAARALANNAQLRALIAADGSAAHRHVVAAMDLLRQVGIHRVAIGVRPER
jgi:biopolymer transport protein ExbD